MKEYNPKSKKWETRTEDVGSLKKPDTCKGHRPHDYVLVLPWHVKLQNGAPYLNAEQIEGYYISEDHKINDTNLEDDFQEKYLKIKVRRHWNSKEGKATRYYTCANCGKKK